MPQVKTSDLTGAALDWAVAKCQGWEGVIRKNPTWSVPLYIATNDTGLYTFSPSTNPAQGHPIIEREGVGFFCNRTAEIGSRFKPDAGADWRAFPFNKHGTHFFGPTALIAAMRCYVASKLGDTVEIPEELL